MTFCDILQYITLGILVFSTCFTFYNIQKNKPIVLVQSSFAFTALMVVVLVFTQIEFEFGEYKGKLVGARCTPGVVVGPSTSPQAQLIPACPAINLFDTVRVSYFKTRELDAKSIQKSLRDCSITANIESSASEAVGGYDQPPETNNRVSYNSRGALAVADPSFRKIITSSVGQTYFDVGTATSESAKKGSVQINLFK